uniref:ACT domain-containing protein n=1 Tax=Kalanchoe fedtschenkoi TaxID=63787 RepID=A0A7N1A754_KALFE
MASHPDTRPAIDIRLAQVHSPANGDNVDSRKSSSSGQIECLSSDFSRSQRHNSLDAELELTVNSLPAHDGERPGSCNPNFSGLMHEITISTYDMPKFLAQLTSILSDIGLNIQEAHAFSTIDPFKSLH